MAPSLDSGVCLFCTGEPRTQSQCSRCGLTSAEQRARITFTDLQATSLLMQFSRILPFFAARESCWLTVTCPPGLSGSSWQSCFPVGWLQPDLGPEAWGLGCSSPGLYFFCWTVRGFCHPNSWACIDSIPEPSQWQYLLLTYQQHTQLCIISELTEDALCPIFHIINEKVRQYWPYYPFLGYTTKDLPPVGLCVSDHKPLSMTVQPVSNILQCPLIYPLLH